ncbi:hypothetical protein Tco_0938901 [Tanacetum coccineum]|uniref:Uncharacterized protein n=1 Tax=Tanacetum coccineum TaxID=301880 RepID=A0ABQ5DII7_9ASTR
MAGPTMNIYFQSELDLSHFVLGQRLPPLGGDGGGGGIGDGSGGGGEGGGVLGNSKENQRGKEDEGISVISHTFGPY